MGLREGGSAGHSPRLSVVKNNRVRPGSPPDALTRRARLAKYYIATSLGVALLPFLLSYVKYLLTGEWLAGIFMHKPGHAGAFGGHVIAGLGVSALLITQLVLGFKAYRDRDTKGASVHRRLGLAIVVIFVAFALHGCYVEFLAGIFGKDLHTAYGTTTFTLVGVLTGYGLISAYRSIRRRDIARHLDDVVFFSIVLSGAGLVRLYVAGVLATGHTHFAFFLGHTYLCTLYLIDVGAALTGITIPAAFLSYVWRTRIWRPARLKIALSFSIILFLPVMIALSHLEPLKFPEWPGLVKDKVVIG
ncbi:DUF2306 domain-containing protein [Mycobacterium marinum]|uniref:DUF2306 domain-containing protein n=1 Tax=Mycobacterium marinum TaxID=1781 RepID=UPI0035677F14